MKDIVHLRDICTLCLLKCILHRLLVRRANKIYLHWLVNLIIIERVRDFYTGFSFLQVVLAFQVDELGGSFNNTGTCGFNVHCFLGF